MKRKILNIILASALVLCMASCAKEPAEEETYSVPESSETEESTYPTGIPFDNNNYTEFEEPVAYNVLSDTDAYTDTDVNEYAMTYVEGSMVIGVATDGHYLVLDNRYVMEMDNLEPMQ